MRVYVALLEKVETLRCGCFTEDSSLSVGGKRWIVMGHFDAMRTYELDLRGRNLFEAMEESNRRIAQAQRSDRYLHPLYLISTEEDGGEVTEGDSEDTGENFGKGWLWNDPYLAIARVHFSKSVDANETFRAVRKKLKKHAKTWNCTCTSFRTVELSDMILAISAEKLSSVLNFALTLRTFPEVGKVYTYAGVEEDKVKRVDLAAKPALCPKDQIDLFSMRFSVSALDKAKGALDHVQHVLGTEGEYSVAGVDDVFITWKNLCVDKLLRLYKEWFYSWRGPLQVDCFSDVTSRVGVSMNKLNIPAPIAPEKSVQALQDRCRELKESCEKNLKREEWAAPLSSLVDTMVRMSHTSVLDEFVYMMYEGVHAFLENVGENVSPIPLDGVNDETGSEARFVENLALLMEHVIRVEGQLTHNPELRPVIYDIPVAMLEYTLAFLQKVSANLQLKDTQKVKISFLLVPRLCQRMKALELFQAVKSLPGLVLVTIPVGSMYEPETIQRELCHEISHFVGEFFRSREIRRERYGYAAAALAAREFFLNDHLALIDAAWQDIKAVLYQDPQENHMRHMTSRIERWAYSLLDDDTRYLRLINSALLTKEAYSEETPLKLSRNVSHLEEIRVHRFCQLLNDLRTLFRETYADVCMLFLLPVELDRYLYSHVKELETEPEEQRPYEQYAIRLYVAIRATERENDLPWDRLERMNLRLCEEMKRLRELIEQEEDDGSSRFPIVSVLNLLSYVETCYKELKSAPDPDGLRPQLRGMFRNIVPGKNPNTIDYEAFLDHIDKYRKQLLMLKAEPTDPLSARG